MWFWDSTQILLTQYNSLKKKIWKFALTRKESTTNTMIIYPFHHLLPSQLFCSHSEKKVTLDQNYSLCSFQLPGLWGTQRPAESHWVKESLLNFQEIQKEYLRKDVHFLRNRQFPREGPSWVCEWHKRHEIWLAESNLYLLTGLLQLKG